MVQVKVSLHLQEKTKQEKMTTTDRTRIQDPPKARSPKKRKKGTSHVHFY